MHCLALMMMFIIVSWCAMSIDHGLESANLPVIGPQPTGSLIGVILFNFGLSSSLPSWINEKRKDVKILNTFVVSSTLAATTYVSIGVFGALAFSSFWQTTDTMLDEIYSIGSRLAIITFYLFPICVNVTSIPVFSIMMRYNLIEEGICGRKMAALIGVFLPWLLCIPLYNGNGYQELVNWTGVVVTSSINFVIPPILYIVALRQNAQRQAEVALNHEQQPMIRTDVDVTCHGPAEVTTCPSSFFGNKLDLLNACTQSIDDQGYTARPLLLQQKSISSVNVLDRAISIASATDCSVSQQDHPVQSNKKQKPKQSNTALKRSNTIQLSLPVTRSPYDIPDHNLQRVIWCIELPWRMLFHYIIPDCTSIGRSKWMPLSVLMCALVGTIIAYCCAWMGSVVSTNFDVTSYLFGLTVMSFGFTVPHLYQTAQRARAKKAKLALSVGSDLFTIMACIGIATLLTNIIKFDVPVLISYTYIEISYLTLFVLASLGIITLQSHQWQAGMSSVYLAIVATSVFLMGAVLVAYTPLGSFISPAC